MIFKKKRQRNLEKFEKGIKEIKGPRLIDENEIRRQLYLKGKAITDDLWDGIRVLLIAIPITIVASIILPAVLSLLLIWAIFLLISFARYLKYYLRIKDFKNGGEYFEEKLEIIEVDRFDVMHLRSLVHNINIDINYYGIYDNKKKAVLYGAKIPVIMVAIINEDGIGEWYDPIEDEGNY